MPLVKWLNRCVQIYSLKHSLSRSVTSHLLQKEIVLFLARLSIPEEGPYVAVSNVQGGGRHLT